MSEIKEKTERWQAPVLLYSIWNLAASWERKSLVKFDFGGMGNKYLKKGLAFSLHSEGKKINTKEQVISCSGTQFLIL